ncbi:MAG: hypothetical protein ACKERF_01205 [Candidatus Hodgkinia cicadicola]
MLNINLSIWWNHFIYNRWIAKYEGGLVFKRRTLHLPRVWS